MYPNPEQNKAAIENPQPGDYWTERMILYHVLLDVLPNGNLVIAKKDRTVREHQTVDYKRAQEITPDEYKRLVTYQQIDGFVADVTRGAAFGEAVVAKWHQDYDRAYLRIGQEPDKAYSEQPGYLMRLKENKDRLDKDINEVIELLDQKPLQVSDHQLKLLRLKLDTMRELKRIYLDLMETMYQVTIHREPIISVDNAS